MSGNLRAALGDAAQGGAASAKGYQWKQLIICDGASITPSQLANANGCGTRNAWRAIWLRSPGATRWELAARLRDARGD